MLEDEPVRRRRKKHRTDPDVRQRAEELHASGIPFQLAMAVALGRVDLNTALARLARQAEVERVMAEHDLSRAVATQIAVGHVSLDVILSRRRLSEHREANRDRSCIIEAHGSGVPMVFGLHGKRKVEARVIAYDAYIVRIAPVEDPEQAENVHKLQFKYAYAPEDWKVSRKAMRTDRALSKEPQNPIPKPQDRYSCSDRRLFRYLDNEIPVVATLLEGTQVRGLVSWFGRYEFGIAPRRGGAITVFRHALHDLTAQ